MRSSGHGIMLVILTCALATANIIECRERFSLHFDFGDAGEDDLVIDEKMVEHTLDQCMNQMINREGDTRSKSRLLCRKKIHQAIDELSPQTEQTLLDCIKKNLNFQLSSEEASFKQLYIEYAQLLVSFQNAPRRFLATELPEERSRKSIPLSPTSGPSALPPTPFSSMPAPAVAPARNMNQVAPASKRSPMPWFRSPPSAPNKITSPSPQPTAKKNAAPAVDSKKKPEKPKHKDIRRQELIIAVVTTAVSTFSLAALLFLCCLRRQGRRIGPRNGPNDGRPLLNSTLSAASGSSQQSISVGSSAKIEVTSESGDNPSLVKNASVKPHSSSSMTEAQSSKDPPTPAPPPPLPTPPGPPPPPPPRRPPAPPKVPAPPPKPVTGLKKPSPLGPHRQARSISSKGNEVEGESGAAKTKLKPFFWDKVLASPDHAMVWHEISSGSFQFNEEMIESLFGCKAATKNPNDRDKSLASSESSSQYIQIIDTRKAQNLSIILKALNLTSEEVVGALQEGSELPVELLQTLLKMAPTTDEELKLRLFAGDVSQLGPAERFLKTLVDIPYAFKRIEALIFMSSHQEDISGIKESFKTLEVACDKLRSSRLFLKLLEAVLKTGNRMNDGTYRGGAQAFRLDTLLKLADVKGTDGKTTLLHFVVQEIIRSEGVRAARTAKASQSMSSLKAEELPENSNPQSVENYCIRGLQVVSGLSTELEDVKKAAVIDADSVTATVSKLSTSLTKTKAFLNTEMKNVEEKTKFYDTVTKFVEDAEKDVEWLLEEEKRIMALVKSTADYFHGNAGRDEGLRLFSIVRDFLVMLDKSCKDVKITTTNPRGTSRKETLSSPPSQESRQPFSDMRKLLFPEIEDRRMDFSSSSSSSSSDDES